MIKRILNVLSRILRLQGQRTFCHKEKIDATEHQQFLTRHLCLEYVDVFSEKLAVNPARLPPFVMKVNKRDC